MQHPFGTVTFNCAFKPKQTETERRRMRGGEKVQYIQLFLLLLQLREPQWNMDYASILLRCGAFRLNDCLAWNKNRVEWMIPTKNDLAALESSDWLRFCPGQTEHSRYSLKSQLRVYQRITQPGWGFFYILFISRLFFSFQSSEMLSFLELQMWFPLAWQYLWPMSYWNVTDIAGKHNMQDRC